MNYQRIFGAQAVLGDHPRRDYPARVAIVGAGHRALPGHQRSTRDFLDALVALGMLERRGELYSNTTETDFYPDRVKPTYNGKLF